MNCVLVLMESALTYFSYIFFITNSSLLDVSSVSDKLKSVIFYLLYELVYVFRFSMIFRLFFVVVVECLFFVNYYCGMFCLFSYTNLPIFGFSLLIYSCRL